MDEKTLTEKLEGIDARLKGLEHDVHQRSIDPAANRQVETQRSLGALVDRIASSAKVSQEDVTRVLNTLGLESLTQNLAETRLPRQAIDGGRLFLSIVANRQLISA